MYIPKSVLNPSCEIFYQDNQHDGLNGRDLNPCEARNIDGRAGALCPGTGEVPGLNPAQ